MWLQKLSKGIYLDIILLVGKYSICYCSTNIAFANVGINEVKRNTSVWK